MASPSPVIEFWNLCPQLECGEPIDFDDGASFCANCGDAFSQCPNCRGTNRILAQFCRGCGKTLIAEIWPMQAGLSSQTQSTKTINRIGAVRSPYPIRLGANVLAPPIAADGLLIFSTCDGVIVLVSESNGRRVGEINVGHPVVVSPALKAGVLFVAAGKRLLAFDLSSSLDRSGLQVANLLWSTDMSGDVVGHPLVIDQTAVYVTAVRHERQESIVEAIAQSDGERLWEEPVTIAAGQITAPVLIEDRIAFSTLSGEVILVAAGSGERLDEFSLRQHIDMLVPPFVRRDRFLLTTVDGGIIEIDVKGGRVNMNNIYSHGARVTALAANERFIALGHTAGLTLVDIHGQVKWSYEGFDSIPVTPITAEDTLFAVDTEGNGLLFNERSSNPLMKVKLFAGEVSTPPIVTRSKIVAASGDGSVVAIDWD